VLKGGEGGGGEGELVRDMKGGPMTAHPPKPTYMARKKPELRESKVPILPALESTRGVKHGSPLVYEPTHNTEACREIELADGKSR